MAEHKLQITYNLSDDKLTVVHRTVTSYKETACSHSEEMTVENEGQLKASLKKLIEDNMEEMEERSMDSTIMHVACVNRMQKKGLKHLKVEGTVSSTGSSIPGGK